MPIESARLGPCPTAIWTPIALALLAGLTPWAARAQAGPAPPAAAAPTPARSEAQKVEITGTSAPENLDERRRSTASRIIIGREELDRMGDSSLGEVLRRLPGVTSGGPPGRGGGVRMRGMGGGYTQILIDGQRMPPGFSLDNVPPEQIERIEIMRAPVAEFGARAIGGTINVVMRSDFKRRANDARVGAGLDGSQPQFGGSWQLNGNFEELGLGYNTNLSAFQSRFDTASDSRTNGGVDDLGLPINDQTSKVRGEGKRRGMFATGRLQFRLGEGKSLDLQPFANLFRIENKNHADRQGLGNNLLSYTAADIESRSETRMARLNGTWLTTLGSGGRLQVRFGSSYAQNEGQSKRLETGGAASLLASGHRLREETSRNRELSVNVNGKYSQLLAEKHSMSLGWDLQRAQRNDFKRSLVNGKQELAQFGDEIDATVQRAALFAQDEWAWSKDFSFYLGGRWEAIETRADSVTGSISNRSSVLTPLAHMVWKLPDRPRDQVRLSLTRSYKSPETNQLIARPSISTLYADLSKVNQPTSPDRAGNPTLKPELAWGLELGIERYLSATSIVSANIYYKRIDELIRTVRTQETVVYASAKRWVARPENIGAADAAGIELEGKMRASDLWTTQLPLQLRANASLMWSRVGQVAGPNNRLEGQPPWTMNLGGDLPFRGTPLTMGLSWNYTPGFDIQQIDQQSYRQGRKSVLDGYALWRLAPEASLRLSISNALGQSYGTGSSTYNLDGSLLQSTDSTSRTYTTVNLRGEFKF